MQYKNLTCNRCDKRFGYRQSLWRHKQRCMPKIKTCGTLDDDDASVMSFGTMDNVINKHAASKRPSSAIESRRRDDRPDIADCFNRLIPISGMGMEDDEMEDEMKEEMKEEIKDEINDEMKEEIKEEMKDGMKKEMKDKEDAKIQKELDAEDVEKVVPEFIEFMIAAPRKRIATLLKSISKGEKVDDLKNLINEFLLGDMQMDKKIESAFRALKTTSTTVEINNIMNEIEDMNSRFADVLHRLDDTDDPLSVLQSLKREHKLSWQAYDELAKHLETSDLSLPDIIKVLKAHPNRKDEKIGHGVVYLPGTVEGLYEKFCLLVAEYKAGNTTTRNEIVAVLDELRNRNLITEKQYTGCNNWLSDDDCVQDICDKLSDLADTYDAGDRSVGAQMLECTNTLVSKGVVSSKDCEDVRNQIIRDA